MNPIDVAQGQLDAYNAQDLEGYMAHFAEDCVIADFNGEISLRGAAAIRARYAAMFAQYPQNHARLVHRICIANTVIDHEDVARTPEGERFEVAAVYTVRAGRIARVDFIKG
jgi:uncharacterized protein (TIGR02246 family)